MTRRTMDRMAKGVILLFMIGWLSVVVAFGCSLVKSFTSRLAAPRLEMKK